MPNPVTNNPISAINRFWLIDINTIPMVDIVNAIIIDFFLPKLSFNNETTIYPKHDPK